MKHILPILTLALLGAAVTAFAADEPAAQVSGNFYYGYYKDPGQSGMSNEYWLRDYDTISWAFGEGYTNIFETQTDTFTYKNFSVTRNSDWSSLGNEANVESNMNNVNKRARIDNSNFYRIQVIGDNVDLYLTDYVDTAGDEYNKNALYHHISEYGYRVLQEGTIEGRSLTPTEIVTGTDTNGLSAKYVASGVTVKNTLTVVDNTPMVTYAGKDVAEELPTIDIVKNDTAEEGVKTIKRYQYYLGTFNDGDIIEVYVKDNNNGEAYSYSGINEIDTTTNAPVGADGAFGDGGYLLNLQTDKMLNNYYFQDENLEPKYPGFGEGEEAERAREAASSKAMPLSALDPSGSRVYFGIIAKVDGVIGGGNGGGNNGTVGKPLPGGLQMALIAGLFGLGFWYIRRRKTVTA